MKSNDIYEFILWDNCFNNCSFCWQKQNGYISSDEDKIQTFQTVLHFLESDKFPSGSHVLIVGGELFDNNVSNIINEFQLFWKNIINLQRCKKIDLVYINTNLLYTNLNNLLFLLQLAKKYDLLQRIKFTTSYDSFGRFNTIEKYKLFSKNLKTIMQQYTQLNCVINTILTKHFCETYNYNESFLTKMQQQYTNRTTVNFLPYVALDDKLIPNKSDVFKVLLNEDKHNNGFLSIYTTSMALKQLKHVFKVKNGIILNYSCNLLECGHSENFKKYSADGSCFVCDLLRITND